MVPIVTRLATDFADRALVATVDVSVHGELADAHGVRGVPTFVFYKDGRETSRHEGTASYAELARTLEALCSR